MRARKPRYRRVTIDPGQNFGRQTLDNTLKDVTVASVRREPLNARDAGAGAQRGETPIFARAVKQLSKLRPEIPHARTAAFAAVGAISHLYS